MRVRNVTAMLITASIAFTGMVQAADHAKPLAVLALTSHDDVAKDVGPMTQIADTSDMPTWLSSMLRLFAEGQGVWGLDASRPWGAVVQLSDGLSSYGFVPVKNVEDLSWELDSYIESITDIGGGIYKVVGTEPGEQLFATEIGGWLFVSDRPETLDSVPADPTSLLGQLNRQYDVALRLELKNVPAQHGQKLLAMLDKTVGPTLRRMTSDQTVETIGRAAYALDQVILGWSQH